MKNVAINDVAFLVVSCDKYSNLWEAFFTLLNKYWPDIQFKLYLLNNFKSFSWPNLKVINVGEDVSYSDNLNKALEKLPQNYIFLWLEDLFISEKVNNERVMDFLSEFQKNEGGYLNLAADMPISYEKNIGSEIGIIPKGVKYRSAIGSTIYRRDTLKKLLIKGASAWELDKSRISDTLEEKFFALNSISVKNPPIKYKNVLIKGKWAWGVKSFFYSEGLEKLLPLREFESSFSFLYAKAYNFRLFFYRLFRIYWK